MQETQATPLLKAPEITNRRFLQGLFAFIAVSLIGLSVLALNRYTLGFFSVDHVFSPSTAQRISLIRLAFLALGVLSGFISAWLGRAVSRPDITSGRARLAAMLTLFVFFFITAEGLLAIRFAPAYLPSQSTRPPLALLDEELGYVLNPAYDDAYRITPQGFRGTEAAGPGEPVIMCLGDSITFGLELNDEWAPYPAQLQKKLRSAGWTNGCVVNAGIPGYASENALRFVRCVAIPMKPTLIILCIGWNDLIASFSSQWTPHSLFTAIQPPADKTPLAIIRAARWLGQRLRENPESRHLHHQTIEVKARPDFRRPSQAPALEQYEKNLVEIVRVCRDAGIPLLLLNMPTVGSLSGMTPTEAAKAGVFIPEAVKPFEDIISRVCESEKTDGLLSVLNLDEGGKDPFFWDHCHVTDKGSREIAARIFEYLKKHSGGLMAERAGKESRNL